MKNLTLVSIGLFLAMLAAGCAPAVPCGGTNCAPIGLYDGHQACDACVAAVPPPPPPPPAPIAPPLTERRGG